MKNLFRCKCQLNIIYLTMKFLNCDDNSVQPKGVMTSLFGWGCVPNPEVFPSCPIWSKVFNTLDFFEPKMTCSPCSDPVLWLLFHVSGRLDDKKQGCIRKCFWTIKLHTCIPYFKNFLSSSHLQWWLHQFVNLWIGPLYNLPDCFTFTSLSHQSMNA